MTPKLTADGWKDYGNLSAVDPPYRSAMRCDTCKTQWLGCWDNFECPECGEGELPSSARDDLERDTKATGQRGARR